MKTRSCLWLVIFVNLFLGCQKEPEPVDSPLATIPSITISPSIDLTVDYDYVCTFTWEVKGSYNNFSTKISLGGEVISNKSQGSIINPMTFSTAFVVLVTMDDGRISSRTVFITVRPKAVEPPKIFLVYANDSIQYNSGFFVEWTTENTTSLWMNNIEVPTYGHFMFTNFTADTVIRFRASGPGGTTDDSITIHVAELPYFMGKIIAHPWSLTVAIASCDGIEWHSGSISEYELGIKYFFYPDGAWWGYHGDTLISNGYFSIQDSLLQEFGGGYQILQMEDSIMILKDPDILYFGCPNDTGLAIRTYGPS